MPGRATVALVSPRTYDTSLLLRCFRWHKEAFESARRIAESKLPAGQRLSLNDFMLEACLDRARKLGVAALEEAAEAKGESQATKAKKRTRKG